MVGYLVVTGALFLIVGLRALFKPVEAVGVPFGVTAEGADGMNYLRSGTGGVTIACGGVILAGGFVASLTFASLVLAVTVLGGLLAGRMFSVAVDGKPGLIVWISAFFELLGFASGAFWLFAG